MNVDGALVTRHGDGTVTVDDPACPLRVRVRVTAGRLTDITVTARHPGARITSSALARLPLRQVRHLASTAAHPNEAYYRALALPRPPGHRGWDEGHWSRVLAVYRWAQDTGRPGGGAAAVAELWQVTRNPTAYRWLAQARRRTGTGRGGGSAPDHPKRREDR